MFSSPLKAVLDARKTKDLGALNPLPWSIILLNCFGWSFYGCLRKDYFVFWSNFPAICLSIFYCLTAFQLLAARNYKGDSATISMLEIICKLNLFQVHSCHHNPDIRNWLGLVFAFALGSLLCSTCKVVVGAFFWGVISLVATVVLPASQQETSIVVVGVASCVCTVSYG